MVSAARDEPAPPPGPEPDGEVLRAEGVSMTRAGRDALRGVDVRLTAGSVTVLAGPNGAGKSTLLAVLSGDLRPDRGRVLLAGRDLHAWAPAELARRRAVMPQETLLSFAFTAEEVVRMGRQAAPRVGRERAAVDDAVVSASMRATETTPLGQRIFPTLSGGEKARVTLARVLAQESPLLFLDEPTASLDPRHQHLVMMIARRAADAGGAVLAVLHDLNLAAQYADQVVLLREGVVRAAAPPVEVLTAETLESVFDTPFEVIEHPVYGTPLVVSLPSGEAPRPPD